MHSIAMRYKGQTNSYYRSPEAEMFDMNVYRNSIGKSVQENLFRYSLEVHKNCNDKFSVSPFVLI